MDTEIIDVVKQYIDDDIREIFGLMNDLHNDILFLKFLCGIALIVSIVCLFVLARVKYEDHKTSEGE